MRLLAAACAGALAASGCAGAAPRETVVTVEGTAPLGPGGAREARARALADARLRALERGGSVRVAALSVVAQGVSQLQRVRSAAGGTVRGLRVLSESARDGLLVLRVRARVADDGAAAVPSLYVEGPPGVRAALLERWRARGGRVAVSAAEADLRARAAFETYPQSEPRLRPFRSWRARVRLEDADGTGAGWAVEREAPGLGLDDEAARAAAVAAAAQVAADELPLRTPASP